MSNVQAEDEFVFRPIIDNGRFRYIPEITSMGELLLYGPGLGIASEDSRRIETGDKRSAGININEVEFIMESLLNLMKSRRGIRQFAAKACSGFNFEENIRSRNVRAIGHGKLSCCCCS